MGHSSLGRWGLKVNTAPAAEPISTAEAKTHLRVAAAFTADDTYIDALVVAARRFVEEYVGRALITQTFKFYLDAFPPSNLPIMLPRPPAIAITTLEYVDPDGVTQSWASSNFGLDIISEPARLHTAHNVTYPTTQVIENAVIVTYTAGYGLAGSDVEPDIIHAMKLLLGQWYVLRTAVCDTQTFDPSFGVKALLAHYKTYYRGPIRI